MLLQQGKSVQIGFRNATETAFCTGCKARMRRY
jgi:hypothetical protein